MRNASIPGSLLFSVSVIMALTGCGDKKDRPPGQSPGDTILVNTISQDRVTVKPGKPVRILTEKEIDTGTIHPDSILAFAKTLIGVPYLYASTDPAKGFDCSGFITYVFNHFNTAVPRSSVDFTNMGREVPIENARRGDLILFTGTDSTIRIVGHMGLVESVKDGQLFFIHSTSGKAKGVVITPFENYYRTRFVKVIRILAEEFFDVPER